MAGRKEKKFSQHTQKTIQQSPVQILSPEIIARREKYLGILTIVVLFAFGVYHSILYFGHTVVPISDFPAFSSVGHQLWSLKAPADYKRAPMLGLLQVPLGWLVGGQYPDLTAGWLLNAILHPFNLLLLWLIGKKIIGKAAVWFAIVAIINPWVLYLLTEPIVETTYLFFILLTFYLLLNRSNYCYLFASIATMVRYEAVALILAAFVIDMIYYKGKKERIQAFLYSASACLPLLIWMLATFLDWNPQTSGDHYLKIFSANSDYVKALKVPYESQIGFGLNANLLWRIAIFPLLTPLPDAGNDFTDFFFKLTKLLAFAVFFFGAIYGLYKRQWNVLALLLFLVPYFVLHAVFPAPLLRYYAPAFWILLLICWFGVQSIWGIINKNDRVPRPAVLIIRGLILVVAFVWLIGLFPYLSKLAQISPRSACVPFVAMGAFALLLLVRMFFNKFKFILGSLVVMTIMCLVVVSNQFGLAQLLGDGQREQEFKLLADWYVANAKPGEKMGLYMASVVQIFATKYVDNIVGLPKADNPSEFVKACYDENITYVVWATREGLSNDHAGYRGANLDKTIGILREAKNIGPYEFVAQVGSNRGYVNIFRLQKPANNIQQKLLAN